MEWGVRGFRSRIAAYAPYGPIALRRSMGCAALLCAVSYVFAWGTTTVAEGPSSAPKLVSESLEPTDTTAAPPDVLRHEVQRPQVGVGTLPPPPSDPAASSGTTRWESGDAASAFDLPTVNGDHRAAGATNASANPTTGNGPAAGSGTRTGNAPGNPSGNLSNAGTGPGTRAFGGTPSARISSANSSERGTSDRFAMSGELRSDETSLSNEENKFENEPPKWSNGTLVLILLISIGLNGYMVWLTLDTRNRYFRLMNEMNGDAQSEEEPSRRKARSSERETRGTESASRTAGTNGWRNGLDRVRSLSRDAVGHLSRRRNRNPRSVDDEDEGEDV